MTVPDSVPSLFQSSVPLVPSSALKYRVLPTAVKLSGLLSEDPTRMSFTMTVPDSVPSLFQSSDPFKPLFPWKYRVDPRSTLLLEMNPSFSVVLMSLTRTVPPGVPSETQSSRPYSRLLMWANNFVGVTPTIQIDVPPTIPSLISSVPTKVPSVLHKLVPESEESE